MFGKMILLYVVSISVWISVTMATKEQPMDEQLASSPLIRSLLERVDILEKHSASQGEEIETLKTQMAQQRGDIMRMQYKLKVKDKTTQSLLRKLQIQSKEETQMHSKLKAKDKTIQSQLRKFHIQSEDETRLSSEKIHHTDSHKPPIFDANEVRKQKRGDDNRIRQAANEPQVAFSAGLTAHMLHVGDNQAIKFDNVITNVGNAYNPHYGIFLAPVPGVYVFSTTIASYDSQPDWAFLAVNGVVKSELYMQNNHTISSQTMVFELLKGDDVAVLGHAGAAYSGIAPPYTTFTGFLLNHSSAGGVIG